MGGNRFYKEVKNCIIFMQKEPGLDQDIFLLIQALT